MLWDMKQHFMVIWGNIQKSKSQRHPYHNCCRPTWACDTGQ